MEREKITQEELNKIIENHGHWLRKDCEGWEGMQADLRLKDLIGLDLRFADLLHADLSFADLSFADLSFADLSHAGLLHADLNSTDLSHADLRFADLSFADLSFADLSHADLLHADLNSTDLSHAGLRFADLSFADLSFADLSCAKNIYHPLACPSDGAFIAWKKATDENGNDCIVKLIVPEDAKRSSSTGRKCRCDFADVLEIQDIEGNVLDVVAVSSNHTTPTATYRVGERVTANGWDENRWEECTNGIHFFITREEAVRR